MVNKDFREAARLYKLAAEQGYAKAAFFLSKLYAAGNGVEQSLETAIKWCKEAQRNGYADAEKQLVIYQYTEKHGGATQKISKPAFESIGEETSSETADRDAVVGIAVNKTEKFVTL